MAARTAAGELTWTVSVTSKSLRRALWMLNKAFLRLAGLLPARSFPQSGQSSRGPEAHNSDAPHTFCQ
jgi:hypothetical protein